jgi:hypothetical protein
VPRTDLLEVVRRQVASAGLGAGRSDPLAVGA